METLGTSLKTPLFGKTISELELIVKGAGLPSFAARQIADWLYKKQASSIDEMTNLSKNARELMARDFSIGVLMPTQVQESSDGTRKFLFKTSGNLFVEAAWIPDESRDTLCVSSQGGCKMGCTFCMTGQQGYQGQLSAGEILTQIRGISGNEKLTNLVFMGMGEPFDNLDEVLKSILILTSDWGYGWSPRRITVSTIGLIPGIKRFIESSDAHLAISLHSPFSAERAELMPIERAYPIEKVVDVIRNYDLGRQRRVSFEYIMFEGLNDTQAHVKGITRLLNGLRCRINLIKFHPVPGSDLKASPPETIRAFADQLNNKGFVTTVRRSRCEDILAACGQLSTGAKYKNTPD